MNISDYISNERLSTFQEFTSNEDRAIALHNHTLQLGSSIMSMIALFELAFRNSTNKQLSERFGDINWLISEDSFVPLKQVELGLVGGAKRQAQKAVYSKLTNREKAALDGQAFPNGVPNGIKHDTRVKARQKTLQVTHGQVIAQTTFAFWKRLYAHHYEGVLWKPCLKKVFPQKTLKRTDISSSLEVVYAARNRVAHHEPIYGARLGEVMHSLSFLRENLGSQETGEETNFKALSRVQFLRLRMDHEAFLEAWRTLT